MHTRFQCWRRYVYHVIDTRYLFLRWSMDIAYLRGIVTRYLYIRHIIRYSIWQIIRCHFKCGLLYQSKWEYIQAYICVYVIKKTLTCTSIICLFAKYTVPQFCEKMHQSYLFWWQCNTAAISIFMGIACCQTRTYIMKQGFSGYIYCRRSHGHDR